MEWFITSRTDHPDLDAECGGERLRDRVEA